MWFVRSSFYFLPVHVWRVCWHFSNFIPTDRHRYLSRKISRSEHSVRWWQLMFSPPFSMSAPCQLQVRFVCQVLLFKDSCNGSTERQSRSCWHERWYILAGVSHMSQPANGIWSNKPMAKLKSSASSSLCDHFDVIVNIGPLWPMIHHHCHVVFV